MHFVLHAWAFHQFCFVVNIVIVSTINVHTSSHKLYTQAGSRQVYIVMRLPICTVATTVWCMVASQCQQWKVSQKNHVSVSQGLSEVQVAIYTALILVAKTCKAARKAHKVKRLKRGVREVVVVY